jgi:hypothetical protein
MVFGLFAVLKNRSNEGIAEMGVRNDGGAVQRIVAGPGRRVGAAGGENAAGDISSRALLTLLSV